MIEHLAGEVVALTPRERATRHLISMLRGCNPIELRDSVSAIVGDVDDYADWVGKSAGADVFGCGELAEASFRYGMAVHRQPIDAKLVLKAFDSRSFHEFKRRVFDRVEDSDARAIWFFSGGVRFASAVRPKGADVSS